MCGIFCSISKTCHILPNEEHLDRLEARGPDNTGSISTTYSQQKLNTADDIIHLTVYSTVLSLRSYQTVTQPYQDTDGKYILCWNGEAWSIDGQRPSGNDTADVHKLLADALESFACSAATQKQFDFGHEITDALSRLVGPYAFVLLDNLHGKIFFGRDLLGRRSLLKRISSEGDLVISSVSCGSHPDGWEEIEPNGVYCVDLHATIASANSEAPKNPFWGGFVTALIPYNLATDVTSDDSSVTSVISRLSLNKSLPLVYERLHAQSPAVSKLQGLLEESLSKRVLGVHNPPLPSDNIRDPSNRAKLAILFSGGLDCTILACVSHRILPVSEPIDLLNVAFENPRIHKTNGNEANVSSTSYERCPDRITGRVSCAELQRTCPSRQWRFVAIDVPYSECRGHREKVISLMHPHNTEMDLSIATALYFASRGAGHISASSKQDPEQYSTSARVLLSGLGADELFAGYTRHATAYRRDGFSALLDELELDVSRLGKRNLGRDDRVMSHWGKEVRFPYLDEDLLRWALKADVTEKCGFGEPDSPDQKHLHNGDRYDLEPGKKVLRCLALKLGMAGVAMEKKRAIQFGARTAKMEKGNTKGTQLLS